MGGNEGWDVGKKNFGADSVEDLKALPPQLTIAGSGFEFAL